MIKRKLVFRSSHTRRKLMRKKISRKAFNNRQDFFLANLQ